MLYTNTDPPHQVVFPGDNDANPSHTRTFQVYKAKKSLRLIIVCHERVAYRCHFDAGGGGDLQNHADCSKLAQTGTTRLAKLMTYQLATFESHVSTIWYVFLCEMKSKWDVLVNYFPYYWIDVFRTVHCRWKKILTSKRLEPREQHPFEWPSPLFSSWQTCWPLELHSPCFMTAD